MATCLSYNSCNDTDTDTTGTDPESECGEYDTNELPNCTSSNQLPGQSRASVSSAPETSSAPSYDEEPVGLNNNPSSKPSDAPHKRSNLPYDAKEHATTKNDTKNETTDDICSKLIELDLDKERNSLDAVTVVPETTETNKVTATDGEEDVFQNLIQLVREQISQIDANSQKIEVQDFDRDQHWDRLDLCVKNLSKECTKLSLSYTKPPYPCVEEGRWLVRDVAKAIDITLAWGLSLPPSEGRTVKKILDNYLQYLLHACQEFLLIMQSAVAGQQREKLIKTSVLWERCDKFPNLPTTTKEAVMQRLKSQLQLVTDGLDELQQSIQESKSNKIEDEHDAHDCDDCFDDEEEWTKEEMQLMKPINGMLMVAKGYLKKVHSSLKSDSLTELEPEQNYQLDEIYEAVEAISSSVDELVMAAYPPIDQNNLTVKMVTVKVTLETALRQTRDSYLKSEDTDKWADFLANAIKHNTDNYKSMITT